MRGRCGTRGLKDVAAGAAVAVLLAAVGGTVGCAASGGSGERASDGTPPATTGATTGAEAGTGTDAPGGGEGINDEALRAEVARSAALLEAAMADGATGPAPRDPAESDDTARLAEGDPPAGGDGASAGEPEGDAAEPAVAAAEPDDGGGDDVQAAAGVEALARTLVDGLMERLSASTDPAGEALAVAALEALVPGIVDETLRDRGELSDAERRVVEAVRDAMAAMRDGRAEPALVAERLAELSAALDAGRPVRIVDAALCTRVTGYGRYETFGGQSFLAGRAQPMIVYTELEGFVHREVRTGDRLGSAGSPGVAASGDRHLIEVAQTIELFAVSGDGQSLLVLKLPAEVDRLTSRNRVRDYYLIRRIDLPSTLRAGRYQLKITIEDRVGGTVAERLIPIDLVADDGLVNG